MIRGGVPAALGASLASLDAKAPALVGGALPVSGIAETVTVAPLAGARGAFGGVIAEGLQPVAGWSFAYGLNGRFVSSRLAGSGTVTVDGGLAAVSTTAAASSSAVLETRRALRYVNGIGGRVVVACRFTTGAAGSRQEAGAGDVSDFVGLGYDGAAFGIWHRRHGRREIRTLTVSVGSGGAENVTVTLDGDAKVVASGGVLSTTALANRLAAQDWSTLGAGWDAQAVGATVVFLSRSAAPRSGAYSLTSTGTAAGTFAQTTAGVLATETHIPCASWSESACSWLDPTKLNVYAISYQWLGAGELRFFIEDPTVGLPILVHRIVYANANTITSLRNPQLPLRMLAENTTNATAIAVYSASAMGFRESLADVREVIANEWCGEGAKTGVTTETAVLSVRNSRTAGGALNRARVVLTGLSCHGEGTGSNALTIRMRRGSTLGGTSAWTAVDADSVCHTDTAGTTVAGGTLLWSGRFARNTGDRIDLSDRGLILAPGEYVTITATSASSVDPSVSLTWREEL